MAKHYLSGRANQRLQDIFRADQATQSPAADAYNMYPLPVLGKAVEPVSAEQAGQFKLQQGRPDVMTDAEETRSAYALCDLAADQLAMLHYCVGKNSGGFWCAIGCSGETEEPVGGETNCEACSTGKLDENFDFNISGVRHATAPANGEGLSNWTVFREYGDGFGAAAEAAMNGTHQLSVTATLGRQYQAGVLIAEPQELPFDGCGRVHISYHSLPVSPLTITEDGNVGGAFVVNGLQLRIESYFSKPTVTSGQSALISVQVDYGNLVGDPKTTGEFRVPRYPSTIFRHGNQTVIFTDQEGDHTSAPYTNGTEYTMDDVGPGAGSYVSHHQYYDFADAVAKFGPTF